MNTNTVRGPSLPTTAGRKLVCCLLLTALTLALLAFFHDPLRPILGFLLPWEFSPTVLLCTLCAAALYTRGVRAARKENVKTGFWKGLSFYFGLGLSYFMLQSQFDYYAQHMFFMQRIQHLMLHHWGPFLIALSIPGSVLARGMPAWARENLLHPVQQSRSVQQTLQVVQHPFIGPLLFVGLFFLWAHPDVQFAGMINGYLYNLMNWSMLIDGLLFWFVMLEPRTTPHARLSYGARIFTLFVMIIPQTLLGASLAFSKVDLYPIYDVCGRFFDLSPIVDQHISGLLIWIPGGMMSVLGTLVILRMLLRDDAQRTADAVRSTTA